MSQVTIDPIAGITFPDLTAQATAFVKGPAFSAYQSTLQSVPNITYSKIQIQTKEFDTANAFDNITNYRFQPLTAGYYQISGSINIASGAAFPVLAIIYKNGVAYKNGTVSTGSAAVYNQAEVSALVYLNGSTDYVELWAYQASGGAVNTTIGIQNTYFQGIFIRGA